MVCLFVYLGLANFDFFQWSSVDCVVTTNFYDKYIITVVTPLLLFVIVLLVFLVPLYVKHIWRQDDFELKRAARMRSTRKFWKLVLFTMFLIYPGVSSIIFRLYLCREVNGTEYLLSDFSIQCGSDEWLRYAYFNLVAILLYPIGIPAFFYFMLQRNRKQLHLPGVRVQLGFLYEAYSPQLWWFEMVDMLNKLVMVSFIGFFPRAFQLPAAMLISVAYLLTIMLLKPYIRKGDDRLHLFAQTEIFIIMLGAYTLDLFGELDDEADVVLSTVLILIILNLLSIFLYQVGTIVRKLYRRAKERLLKGRKKDDEGVEMGVNTLAAIRLPRNANMVMNPLYGASASEGAILDKSEPVGSNENIMSFEDEVLPDRGSNNNHRSDSFTSADGRRLPDGRQWSEIDLVDEVYDSDEDFVDMDYMDDGYDGRESRESPRRAANSGGRSRRKVDADLMPEIVDADQHSSGGEAAYSDDDIGGEGDHGGGGGGSGDGSGDTQGAVQFAARSLRREN
eukprot:TRINITY_DN65931_c10_g3_i2.p1 TRINITY_DN65931_c10_g3~~TRINITY_DN65931_c10_g3_i2.p1  ORF type:complete len:506 (+),score=273.25 TRINITY_DN65931_c10_g3_i2:97-1614(+)